MNASHPQIDQAWLARVTPVVLVGGKSRRFGRDKLQEQVGDDGALVDRSVHALRTVFGKRVMAVGACDSRVRERFDGELADPYPGLGPMGGILAALESADGDVFVLAGDLVGVTPECVHAVLRLANKDASADAVIATTERDHPTFGLYRRSVLDVLRDRVANKQLAMRRALSDCKTLRVAIDPGCAENVNRPEDLRSK